MQGPSKDNVSQVQWDLLEPVGNKTLLIIYSVDYGVNIPDSPLKGRVEITEQSLIIRDVELGDAGLYVCSISTFPSGSFDGKTNLIVKGEISP